MIDPKLRRQKRIVKYKRGAWLYPIGLPPQWKRENRRAEKIVLECSESPFRCCKHRPWRPAGRASGTGEWSGLGRAPKRPDGTAKRRSQSVSLCSRCQRLGRSVARDLRGGKPSFSPLVTGRDPVPSFRKQPAAFAAAPPTRRQTLGALLAEELSQEEAARLGKQARRDALTQLLQAALPNGGEP